MALKLPCIGLRLSECEVISMAGSNHGLRLMERSELSVRERQRDEVRILLIGDENLMPDITTLQSAGYHLYQARGGDEALQKFHYVRPDLILLNVGLPDMDGKQVLKRLRALTSVPIIVLSAQHEEAQQIACLDTGADDYLTKLITPGELLAKLRAVLRRAFGTPRNEIFATGDLKVNFSRREVFVRDEQIKLTATEYDLLKDLASHAGLARTHYQLIHELWGNAQYRDALHLLRVTMSNLRRKLMCHASVLRCIATEPGVGYRLRTDFN